MLGAAHGQQGHDVASSKATPNGSRILPRSPSTQSGRCRGRPRAPCSGGIASPTPGLLVSRSDSRRSDARRAACLARRKADGACFRAWPDQLDSAQFGPRRYRADGTTVYDPGPINLIVAREPIQQRKMDQIPHPRLLPVAQATPARHPRPACEFLREHLPENAAAEDEDDAGETRTVRNARPSAFRSTWWSGQERSTRSHNGSESSAAAIPVHATSPTRIRYCRFCYTP